VAIIGDLVPPRERGRYQGLMLTGPLAGVVITGHLSWRWAFYVIIPLGAIAFLLAS
jgi:MFS family permease